MPTTDKTTQDAQAVTDLVAGWPEKATVDRERESTLRPSAWFVDEVDDATLEKVAGWVRTALS